MPHQGSEEGRPRAEGDEEGETQARALSLLTERQKRLALACALFVAGAVLLSDRTTPAPPRPRTGLSDTGMHPPCSSR